jgi:hypothetical protein
MNRIAGRDFAAPIPVDFVGFNVREVGFDIPQAVFAAESLALDLAGVNVFSRGRGAERHGGLISSEGSVNEGNVREQHISAAA